MEAREHVGQMDGLRQGTEEGYALYEMRDYQGAIDVISPIIEVSIWSDIIEVKIWSDIIEVNIWS